MGLFLSEDEAIRAQFPPTRYKAVEAERLAASAQALSERAQALYPRDPYLQREWVRAVRLVRATSRGWQLERK